MEEAEVWAVSAALRRAPKYRRLCEGTVLRLAAWALDRHPDEKGAVKAAKRKLHQVYGAFCDPSQVARVERLVEGVAPDGGDDDLRRRCREIMACHASTAERLPILETLYPALFGEIGPPASILDLACGLNPFSLPWMGLGPGTVYRAWDLDEGMTGVINRFLTLLGRAPLAETRDLLVDTVDLTVDTVLLFKTFPCLEQQEKGAGVRLMRSLKARRVVVSFPARSLGGREKGMAAHYDRYMRDLSRELGMSIRPIPCPGEVFYCCEWPGPRGEARSAW